MRERTSLNDTINSLRDQLAESHSSVEASQTGTSSSLSKMQEEFQKLSMQAEGGCILWLPSVLCAHVAETLKLSLWWKL